MMMVFGKNVGFYDLNILAINIYIYIYELEWSQV